MTVAPRYAPYADVEATGLAAPLLLPPECSQPADDAADQDDWWSSHAVFHRFDGRLLSECHLDSCDCSYRYRPALHFVV